MYQNYAKNPMQNDTQLNGSTTENVAELDNGDDLMTRSITIGGNTSEELKKCDLDGLPAGTVNQVACWPSLPTTVGDAATSGTFANMFIAFNSVSKNTIYLVSRANFYWTKSGSDYVLNTSTSSIDLTTATLMNWGSTTPGLLPSSGSVSITKGTLFNWVGLPSDGTGWTDAHGKSLLAQVINAAKAELFIMGRMPSNGQIRNAFGATNKIKKRGDAITYYRDKVNNNATVFTDSFYRTVIGELPYDPNSSYEKLTYYGISNGDKDTTIMARYVANADYLIEAPVSSGTYKIAADALTTQKGVFLKRFATAFWNFPETPISSTNLILTGGTFASPSNTGSYASFKSSVNTNNCDAVVANDNAINSFKCLFPGNLSASEVSGALYGQ